jgi:Skp family chaperone for outer membrane proteins
MKKLLSIMAAAAVFFSVSGAMAADAPAASYKPQAKTPVVIIIDVNKIMTESAAAKSVHDQVGALRKSLKDEVDKKEANLRSEDDALAKQRSTLSADDFEKKSRSFQEDVMKSRQDVDKRVAALDKSVNDAMGKIQTQLQSILFDIAKEQNANLVLPKAAILVAETSMDFTDQAMTRINSKLPSVKVEVPASVSSSSSSSSK